MNDMAEFPSCRVGFALVFVDTTIFFDALMELLHVYITLGWAGLALGLGIGLFLIVNEQE